MSGLSEEQFSTVNRVQCIGFVTLRMITRLSESPLQIKWGGGLERQQRLWQYVLSFSETYRKFISELPTYDFTLSPTPKIFWWCWLQGEQAAPPICKVCLKALRKYYPDYQINIITNDNMMNYVEFPKHVSDKYRAGRMSRTHFSDMLRLELLLRYGGVWIDATVFCVGREEHYLDEPLLMFKSNKISFGTMSSWFIVSCKDHPILKMTRDILYQYWRDHNRLDNYFLVFVAHRFATARYPHLWNAVPFFWRVIPSKFQGELLRPYNEKRFNQLEAASRFHKLSYKLPTDRITPDKSKGTYYEKIISL